MREPRPFDELQLPVDADGRAAQVALLARDLARQRLPGEEMRADDDGIHARAEVVHVGDRHHTHASLAQGGDAARAARRLEEVAVPGGIEGRLALAVTEELARRLEPQRDELIEDERRAQTAVRDVLADRRIGGEARHQRHGDGDTEDSLEARRLLELRLEKALAVYCRHRRLDDPAETRGHAAREHDLCDLSTTKRLEAGGSRLLVSRIARGGERGDLVAVRRLDRAFDEVRSRRQLSGDNSGSE